MAFSFAGCKDDVDYLNDLFMQELLCDFAIYDKMGSLLLGRYNKVFKDLLCQFLLSVYVNVI